jgi:hypothetical protein
MDLLQNKGLPVLAKVGVGRLALHVSAKEPMGYYLLRMDGSYCKGNCKVANKIPVFLFIHH